MFYKISFHPLHRLIIVVLFIKLNKTFLEKQKSHCNPRMARSSPQGAARVRGQSLNRVESNMEKQRRETTNDSTVLFH
jgi:hypothetical protein